MRVGSWCTLPCIQSTIQSFLHFHSTGLPHGSDSKETACSAGGTGLIPGLGRSPREGHGYPLQYSCLEDSMDRGA